MRANLLNRIERFGGDSHLNDSQLQMDVLLEQASASSTDIKSILAMSTASFVGQALNCGLLNLSLFKKLPFLLSRPLAKSFSLLGEAAALTGIESLRTKTNFDTRFRQQIVMLGSLHLFGAIRSPSWILSHSLTSLGMVAGQNLSAALGYNPNPEGTFTEQWFHAEVENLQWQGGNALLHLATANRLHHLQRQLHFSIENVQSKRTSSWENASLLQFHANGDRPSIPPFTASVFEARALRRRLNDLEMPSAERLSTAEAYLNKLRALESGQAETISEILRGILQAREGMARNLPESYLLYPRSLEVLSFKTGDIRDGQLAATLHYEEGQIYEALHNQSPHENTRSASIEAYPFLLRARLRISRDANQHIAIFKDAQRFLEETQRRSAEIHPPSFYQAISRSVPQVFRGLAPYFCDTEPYGELLQQQSQNFRSLMIRLRFAPIVPFVMNAYVALAEIPEPSPSLDLQKEEVVLELIQHFSNHGRPEVREQSLFNVLELLETLPANSESIVALLLQSYHAYQDMITDSQKPELQAREEGVEKFIRLFGHPRPVSPRDFQSLLDKMNGLLAAYDRIPREGRTEADLALRSDPLLRILALLRRSMLQSPEEVSREVH